MQISSTLKTNQLKQLDKTAPAKGTNAAPAEETTVPTDSSSITFENDKVKIGTKEYDGEAVDVTMKAPLSHKIIAGIGAVGAIGCAVQVGSHVLSQPTLGGKVVAGALAAGAAFAGLAAADFGSGVFHHFIDNYPKKPDQAKPGELTWDTPVIGDIAAEFQVHHHFTRDLEKVPFISNLAPAGKALAPALLGLALFSPSPMLTAAAGTFLAGGMFAQGSHRWTHEPNPPTIGKFMQKVGLAQSKEDHFTHHKMPWSDNYCIVNGMFNPVLTKNDFWRKVECAIYKTTGAEPNSWRDPGVKELALGEITKEEFLTRRGDDKKTFKGIVKAADERNALRARLDGREDLMQNHAPT